MSDSGGRSRTVAAGAPAVALAVLNPGGWFRLLPAWRARAGVAAGRAWAVRVPALGRHRGLARLTGPALSATVNPSVDPIEVPREPTAVGTELVPEAP